MTRLIVATLFIISVSGLFADMDSNIRDLREKITIERRKISNLNQTLTRATNRYANYRRCYPYTAVNCRAEYQWHLNIDSVIRGLRSTKRTLNRSLRDRNTVLSNRITTYRNMWNAMSQSSANYIGTIPGERSIITIVLPNPFTRNAWAGGGNRIWRTHHWATYWMYQKNRSSGHGAPFQETSYHPPAGTRIQVRKTIPYWSRRLFWFKYDRAQKVWKITHWPKTRY